MLSSTVVLVLAACTCGTAAVAQNETAAAEAKAFAETHSGSAAGVVKPAGPGTKGTEKAVGELQHVSQGVRLWCIIICVNPDALGSISHPQLADDVRSSHLAPFAIIKSSCAHHMLLSNRQITLYCTHVLSQVVLTPMLSSLPSLLVLPCCW